MKSKFNFVLLIHIAVISCLPLFVAGQDSMSYRLGRIGMQRDRTPLQIGEYLPDFGNHKMVSYNKEEINLKDLKGKIIILDFWHQYCPSCLIGFPELVKLQKKYGDQLFILPVTFQSKESITKFIEKRKQLGRPINLPSIVEDTILRRYFPHDAAPYDVWIDAQGQVIGLTRNDAITDARINSVLKGDFAELKNVSFNVTHNREEPLLVNNNGGADSSFIYRSIITNHNPGLVNDISWTPIQNDRHKRIYCYNMVMLRLFKWAMSNKINQEIVAFDPMNKRLVVEGNKLDRRWVTEYTAFEKQNLFCYELITPVSFSTEQILSAAADDLKRFFNVEVFQEKRKTKCMALVRTSTKDKVKTSGIDVQHKDDGTGPVNPHFEVYNSPIEQLARYFNVRLNLPIVVDETNYKGNIDVIIDLPNSYTISEVREALSKYDLDLIEVEREIEMLVIKDKDHKAK